jgi:uncharacterized protein (DUF58 family)
MLNVYVVDSKSFKTSLVLSLVFGALSFLFLLLLVWSLEVDVFTYYSTTYIFLVWTELFLWLSILFFILFLVFSFLTIAKLKFNNLETDGQVVENEPLDNTLEKKLNNIVDLKNKELISEVEFENLKAKILEENL